MIADLPDPPYYAVIFCSVRDEMPGDGYAQTADDMVRLAADQPGFLGLESSARDENQFGVTISYWRDEQSIKAWKNVADHAAARQAGRDRWYRAYATRVAKVERAYAAEREG